MSDLIELPSNRKFGFFFACIFLGVAGYSFAYDLHGLVISGLLGSAGFFAVAIVKPELLLKLNKLWMRLGHILGLIVTPIVMGMLFFGIFAPLGILMRVFGRDELRLKLKPKESHWKLREPDNSDVDAFKHQF